MGGEGEVADGLDGRATPVEDRDHTPNPNQVALARTSSSSSTTNNNSSTLVVPTPVPIGLTGATTKTKLFVAMFESVVGTDIYSTELEKVLVKRNSSPSTCSFKRRL